VQNPQPVADADGKLAGWVLPESARAQIEVDEARTQTPALDDKGVPVQDLGGNVVGYLLPCYGRFVPVSLAQDPAIVEKLNSDLMLVIKKGRVFRPDGTLA
jgi:hypothetical protein